MCDSAIFNKIKEVRTKIYLDAVEKAPFYESKSALCLAMGIRKAALDTIEHDYGYPSVLVNSRTFSRKPELSTEGRSKKLSEAFTLYEKLKTLQKNGTVINNALINSYTSDPETVKWLTRKLEVVSKETQKKVKRVVKAGDITSESLAQDYFSKN
jgi:hypothetical protein